MALTLMSQLLCHLTIKRGRFRGSIPGTDWQPGTLALLLWFIRRTYLFYGCCLVFVVVRHGLAPSMSCVCTYFSIMATFQTILHIYAYVSIRHTRMCMYTFKSVWGFMTNPGSAVLLLWGNVYCFYYHKFCRFSGRTIKPLTPPIT